MSDSRQRGWSEGADDLSIGRIYRVLVDEGASAEGLVRVVDDSGEDYLYPSGRFVAVSVAEAEVPKLPAASATNGS